MKHDCVVDVDPEWQPLFVVHIFWLHMLQEFKKASDSPNEDGLVRVRPHIGEKEVVSDLKIWHELWKALLQSPVKSSAGFDGRFYRKHVHFQAVNVNPDIPRRVNFLHIVWIHYWLLRHCIRHRKFLYHRFQNSSTQISFQEHSPIKRMYSTLTTLSGHF